MLHIITTFFRVRNKLRTTPLLYSWNPNPSLEASHAREQEYLLCITRNILSSSVKQLHLLCDSYSDLRYLYSYLLPSLPSQVQLLAERKLVALVAPQFNSHAKECKTPSASRQATYADLFYYASQMISDELILIANADIYLLDEQMIRPTMTWNKCKKTFFSPIDDFRVPNHSAPPLAFALTRYEKCPVNSSLDDLSQVAPFIHNYQGSHDAFLLLGSAITPSLVRAIDHPQNAYKAENVVIHELRQHKFQVWNPCLSIRIGHEHHSSIRNWLPPVDESRYAKAPPCSIDEILSTLKKADRCSSFV